MSTSLRLAIGLACAFTALTAAQAVDTDAARDLRRFYEVTHDRAVWIDAGGRPTPEAHRVLARLRSAEEDGLVAADYRAGTLSRQARALEGLAGSSAVDTAAFDVGLTSSVLRYFRELHLGRVSPRSLGFHLDHAGEPHDFPSLLHAAIRERAFDRVVHDLRPPFVQYRELKKALADARPTEPARARQIELAMERLRWLPDMTGQRLIVVNIPMFQLWGWEAERRDGVPAIQMPVIIGRAAATKTPVFSAELTSVMFNPDWIVPDSIVRNEILPAMRADPDYLARHHMEVTAAGPVPRIRQHPGPWNALGRVKFLLPNEHDVYLHDTPAASLFARERRDFSHGCVRVAEPLALAEWVLAGEEAWTRERIEAAIATGATRVVRLRRSVQVVIFYMTAAYMPEDGEIRMADDIYGHDARLEARLRARSGGDE